ncbi:hypothetical protein Psed_1131 [Pseudonocardia dioxanivorans CB1190]|uniref:Uncharacterized protein n=1 Tax=Pseudonocardia dioxanivorans (strain ATCC 55486 / DSM 44775 / JCM 13855 / CB1190) TaxID=675635 RepID=F4CSH7_PSEUX|nr:hypothetical protein Psed_1131 [Pseudonocardia dioxanivorans CB1190]
MITQNHYPDGLTEVVIDALLIETGAALPVRRATRSRVSRARRDGRAAVIPLPVRRVGTFVPAGGEAA